MKALELAVVDERAQRYLRATPASPADVPEGRVVVHNAVFPTGRRLNENGFRAWLQIPSERVEVVPASGHRSWASTIASRGAWKSVLAMSAYLEATSASASAKKN
jgi:hypothetical protein